MFIVSDKENKMMEVVDVYIKAMKDKDSGEVTGYMLMGIPNGSARGQILAMYDKYEDAQAILKKLAKKLSALEMNEL